MTIIDPIDETDLFGNPTASGCRIDRDGLAALLGSVLAGMTLDEFVACLTNPYAAALDYANLCNGDESGQKISLLFNPHRLQTRGGDGGPSIYESLNNGSSFIAGLARASIFKNGLVNELLYQIIQLGVNGVSYVNEFPPHKARDLAIQYGCSRRSLVLDPCGGWGCRMLGVSTICDRYCCCEPSTRTANGLQNLRNFIKRFRPEFDAEIFICPFEEHLVSENCYDFALTSPPYYDTEKYSDEPTNSLNKFKSYAEWRDGFYAPLIHQTMAALKPESCFVLNIGSRKYPLSADLFKICKGVYAVSKIDCALSGVGGLGKSGEGETFYEIRKAGR